MPRPLVLPPLSNWQDFEDLCLDLWRRLWNDPNAQKHGRQGQPQAGVDLYARPDGGRDWAGMQCKRFDRLTPKVIEEEVAKARTFFPPLSRFVIATTAPSDVHCQKAAREITDMGFPVAVVSWDEICHHLEDHPDLLRKYFPGLIEPPPTCYRCMAVPPERGFVEREELEEIRTLLCGDGTSAVGITSALRGAGGFGKTTLAQALCLDVRVRAAYPDGILWTTIGDQASPADRLSRVLDLIRWWTRADPPHFGTVTAAAAHLREILSGQRVLVVVDDAWTAADVEPFRGAGAGLLVTTRLSETLPDGCTCIDVGAMQMGEAVELLAKDLPGAEGLRPRFEGLVRTIGESPTLLKLVNRMLRDLLCKKPFGVEEAIDAVIGQLLRNGVTFTFGKDGGGGWAPPVMPEPIQLKREAQAGLESQRRTDEERTRFEQAVFSVRAYVAEQKITPPKTFISYAWGEPSHERWVEKLLATDLQKAGIDVVLDRWENSRIGSSILRFVERIEECGQIIVIGTPLYRQKAKNLASAKGSVVAAEWDLAGIRLLAAETQKQTVLPVLLAGEEFESFPPLLRGRVYGDFRKEEAYFAQAFDLILDVYDIPYSHPEMLDLRESLRKPY